MEGGDRGLRVQRDLRADQYLQTQIDRYEQVLSKWWDRAINGHDAKAANIVLRALERLDRVLRLNPPGESGDSTLIETMLLHRYSSRYRRFAPISRAAYLRSIHTGAGC